MGIDVGTAEGMAALEARVEALQRLLDRARTARREAERVLEERSRALFRSQQELRDSERRFRTLAEHASDLVAQTDPDGVLQWVSPSFGALGWRPDDLVGCRVVDLVHPEDRASAEDALRDVAAGLTANVELRFPQREGERHHWFRGHVEPVADDHGTVAGQVWGCQNIDAERAARVALAGSEARFRRMFAEHGATMLLVDPETGAIVDANHAAAAFYGHPPEVLRTMRISQINALPPSEVRRQYQNAADGIRKAFVFPHRLADGSVRTVEVHSSPIQDGDRHLLFSIVRDITDEVAAREALSASEERFRGLAESMVDVVVTHDPVGRITWASPSVRRVLGFDPTKLVGVRLAELMHPDDAHDPSVHVREDPEGAERGREYACRSRYRHADGGYRMMDCRTTFRFSRRGALVAGQGVLRDVDSEVRADDELRESRTRYRLLAENSGDVVLLLGGDGRITWASPSVTRLTGWEPDALVGVATFDLAHPEDLPAVQAARGEVLAGGQAAFLTRVRRADGGWRWINVVSRAVLDDAGTVTGIVTNWRDAEAEVSARRLLEQAYDETAEARATLQASLDASVDAFAVYDIVRDPDDRDEVLGLRLVLMNLAGAAPLGVEPEDIVGQDLRDFYPDAVTTGLWSVLVDAVRTGAPVSFRNDDPHTGSVWDNRATPVGEDRVVNVWRDVTVQARAERELALSEERFRVAMTASPVPMMLASEEGRLTEVNDALSDMLGHTREDLIGMALADLAHPEDRELTGIPSADDVREGRVRAVRELRFLTRSGDVRWGQLSVSVVRGHDERPRHVIAQILDVTDLRAAQDELAHAALHDPLTGLANRAMFRHELDASHTRARRTGESLAVLFCDLDRFKRINDTYGHHVGDAVLVEVAGRLRSAVRASDVVARLGGDEFVVIAVGLHVPDEAVAMAERITARVAEPLTVDGIEITPETSIGVAATGATPDSDPDELVRRADSALYQAKVAGRNQWRLHQQE